MTEAIVFAVTLSAGLLALAISYLQSRRERSRLVPTEYDQCWCGFQTDATTVHRVFEVQNASDLVESGVGEEKTFRPQRGEGTAVSADFCGEHCPGNCNRGCEERNVQLPWKKVE